MLAKKGNGLKSWEYPKHSGIKIRELINSTAGNTYNGSYVVAIPRKLTGTVVTKKQFKDKQEAYQWADEQYDGYKKQGEEHFALSSSERREVSVNIPILREHGITLSEAVQFAVKRLKPKGGQKALQAVIDELLESKKIRFKKGTLRESSYRDFKNRSGKFSEVYGNKTIHSIECNDIKEWLIGLEAGPRSTQNYLRIVSEIFRYALQKKYIALSPLDELTDVDRKELFDLGAGAKEPSILSPDQAKKLLKAAYGNQELKLLTPVVLALFCGLRTEELKRLDWKHINLGESQPYVSVSAEIAKKRRIRNVEIPPNAAKWLLLIEQQSGPITDNKYISDYQKRFRKLLEFAGFRYQDKQGCWHSNWEINCMRHSFGSYHYALHSNPLETSRLLGHKASDQVLFDHYRALATKQQAKSYFGIKPPKEASNIITFNQTA